MHRSYDVNTPLYRPKYYVISFLKKPRRNHIVLGVLITEGKGWEGIRQHDPFVYGITHMAPMLPFEENVIMAHFMLLKSCFAGFFCGILKHT